MIATITLLAGLVSGPASTGSATHVRWQDVQRAIADTICVEKSIDEGESFLYVVLGRREACGLPPPADVVDKAVSTAFAESGSLLVSLKIDKRVREAIQGIPEETWTAHARSVYLRDVDFLRSLLPRTEHALRELGLACADCEQPPSLPTRTVRWSEIAPYLGAHVWPDPVYAHIGPDGKPTGKRRYPFHICLDLNGIDEMVDPDPQLVRAGFVLAMDSGTGERGMDLVNTIVQEPELLALDSNEDRTRYMRGRLPALIATDPAVKRDVCELLQKYTKDLGIVIEDCTTGR